MVSIIVFSIISLIIFIYTFLRMLKDNNSNYLFALIPEFLGIAIDFLCIFFSYEPNIAVFIVMYFLSVILPITIIILEKNDIRLLEILNIYKSKYFEKKNDKEQAKRYLLKNIKQFPNSYLSHKYLGEWYEKNNVRLFGKYLPFADGGIYHERFGQPGRAGGFVPNCLRGGQLGSAGLPNGFPDGRDPARPQDSL